MQTIREEDAHNRLGEEKQALTDSDHEEKFSSHSNLFLGQVESKEKLGSELPTEFEKAIRPSSKTFTIENQTDPGSMILTSDRS